MWPQNMFVTYECDRRKLLLGNRCSKWKLVYCRIAFKYFVSGQRNTRFISHTSFSYQRLCLKACLCIIMCNFGVIDSVIEKQLCETLC
jgi:hypothetical protein